MRLRSSLAVLASIALASIAALASCGSSLPRRLVLEESIDDLRYERYQRVLDVEFPFEGNRAVGHTALYVQRERGEHRHIVSAFVTAYRNGRGLAANVRIRVRGLEGYRARIEDVSGENVWILEGTDGDRWALWISGVHLVKVGAPEGPELPEDAVEAYLDVYPSDLDERGFAEPGSRSAGRATIEEGAPGPQGVPLPTDAVRPAAGGGG